MVKICLAFGCGQKFTKDTDISFYNLPKDKERQTKWLAALNQKGLDVKSFHVICSKHFKPNDFNVDPAGRQILKPFAVPSVFDKKYRKRRSKITHDDVVVKKYNFRDRKTTANKNFDHTYSTSKPEPSPRKKVSTDHRYSSLDHTYTKEKPETPAPLAPLSLMTNLRHDEHNYSLNSQKKRGSGGAAEEVPQNQSKLKENLDLRDHTYSKSDKKLKKVDKKTSSADSPQVEQPPGELAIAPPALVDCVLLSQVGRERVAPKTFEEIKPNLFILEPSEKDLVNNPKLEFELAPIPFTPTYVLINAKFLKASKAEQRMEQASLLFEEAFGKTLPPTRVDEHRITADTYENELCCEGIYTDELLRRCAVRRRFAQPRYVGDYTLADMSCEKNAKRYYELTKTRLDSQKYLIRKLRTQNSRLSARFKKLTQEIVKVKKLLTVNKSSTK